MQAEKQATVQNASEPAATLAGCLRQLRKLIKQCAIGFRCEQGCLTCCLCMADTAHEPRLSGSTLSESFPTLL